MQFYPQINIKSVIIKSDFFDEVCNIRYLSLTRAARRKNGAHTEESRPESEDICTTSGM